MQRAARAYLNDIHEAAAAIQEATANINVETYSSNRLIRSAVEREFIIIGEALRVIGQQSPELFNRIPEASQIIDFNIHDLQERFSSCNLSDATSAEACSFQAQVRSHGVIKANKKLPWRHWPKEVREDALSRLLALNAERFFWEKAIGLHSMEVIKPLKMRKLLELQQEAKLSHAMPQNAHFNVYRGINP